MGVSVKSSIPILDDVYVYDDDTSDTKHVFEESGNWFKLLGFHLTCNKEEGIKHEIVITGVVAGEPLKYLSVVCYISPSLLSSESLSSFLSFMRFTLVLVMLYQKQYLIYTLLGNLYISFSYL